MLKYREITWQLCLGTSFLLWLNTVLVAAFPRWSTAVIVRSQQHHTHLHYRSCWKCSPLAWIHFPPLLNRFWLTCYIVLWIDEDEWFLWVLPCMDWFNRLQFLNIPTDWRYQLQKLSLATGSCGQRVHNYGCHSFSFVLGVPAVLFDTPRLIHTLFQV
jgi:hypothetical protein